MRVKNSQINSTHSESDQSTIFNLFQQLYFLRFHVSKLNFAFYFLICCINNIKMQRVTNLKDLQKIYFKIWDNRQVAEVYKHNALSKDSNKSAQVQDEDQIEPSDPYESLVNQDQTALRYDNPVYLQLRDVRKQVCVLMAVSVLAGLFFLYLLVTSLKPQTNEHLLFNSEIISISALLFQILVMRTWPVIICFKFNQLSLEDVLKPEHTATFKTFIKMYVLAAGVYAVQVALSWASQNKWKIIGMIAADAVGFIVSMETLSEIGELRKQDLNRKSARAHQKTSEEDNEGDVETTEAIEQV